jgi:Flp pilus assembly protein TadG
MKFRLKEDSGAALIELAVVTPLFIFITIGAFELGRVAHFTIEVENAARAGASFGGENMGNATSTSTVSQAAQNDAPDLTLTATPGAGCVCETLDLTSNTPTYNPASGTVSCSDPIITACTGSSSTVSYNVVSYVTVSTKATVNSVFSISGLPMLGPSVQLPTTYTLHGYSAMRILPN